MVKQKKLYIPTYNEIKEKIRNHQLWLKGDSEDKKWIFTNLDLSTPANQIYEEIDESFNKKKDRRFYDIFEWNDLQYSDFSNSILDNFSFENSILSNSNFKNSDIRWCNFRNAILKNTDFRGSNFEFKQFSKQQQEDAFFTDSQYEKYISKLENKNIIQEKTLENINVEKTEKLVSWFEKLQNEFLREERLWLFISILTFTFILCFAFLLVIGLYFPKITPIIFLLLVIIIFIMLYQFPYLNSNEKLPNTKKTKIEHILNVILIVYLLFAGFFTWIIIFENSKKITESLIINNNLVLVPIWLLMFSFLYFSIYQYSKAKNLRIENQNKVTLLYWFEAIKTDTTPDINKPKFYNKIADEVFKWVFEEKNTWGNLPIDKVIDIITSLKK